MDFHRRTHDGAGDLIHAGECDLVGCDHRLVVNSELRALRCDEQPQGALESQEVRLPKKMQKKNENY
jgi:Holliday junction resolvase-like predicted endonuclease